MLFFVILCVIIKQIRDITDDVRLRVHGVCYLKEETMKTSHKLILMASVCCLLPAISQAKVRRIDTYLANEAGGNDPKMAAYCRAHPDDTRCPGNTTGGSGGDDVVCTKFFGPGWSLTSTRPACKEYAEHKKTQTQIDCYKGTKNKQNSDLSSYYNPDMGSGYGTCASYFNSEKTAINNNQYSGELCYNGSVVTAFTSCELPECKGEFPIEFSDGGISTSPDYMKNIPDLLRHFEYFSKNNKIEVAAPKAYTVHRDTIANHERICVARPGLCEKGTYMFKDIEVSHSAGQKVKLKHQIENYVSTITAQDDKYQLFSIEKGYSLQPGINLKSFSKEYESKLNGINLCSEKFNEDIKPAANVGKGAPDYSGIANTVTGNIKIKFYAPNAEEKERVDSFYYYTGCNGDNVASADSCSAGTTWSSVGSFKTIEGNTVTCHRCSNCNIGTISGNSTAISARGLPATNPEAFIINGCQLTCNNNNDSYTVCVGGAGSCTGYTNGMTKTQIQGVAGNTSTTGLEANYVYSFVSYKAMDGSTEKANIVCAQPTGCNIGLNYVSNTCDPYSWCTWFGAN